MTHPVDFPQEFPRWELKWQPIETAPTEGQSVLLSGVGYAGTRWVVQGWCDGDSGWWEANVDKSDAHGAQIYPTHWMPLPPPPSL